MAHHLSFDMLSRLVESRGSIAEEARARRHLASCARCRSELEWLQRIHGGPGRAAGFEGGWGGLDEGPVSRNNNDDAPLTPPAVHTNHASTRSSGLRLY